jgi:bifunctional DNA-binding transcriptional regulator/antitoxin component of YhaV-PrlF toxin-antitoxin module
MLAKLTSKNQITLPSAIARQFPGVVHFLVTAEDGRVVLEPARIQRADAVRDKLAQLGIGEADVVSAVKWARRKRG